jgi:hypothetical protein
MTSSQIEPRLFDLLDEYCAAIIAGTIRSATAVRRSSNVITFLRSFFEQLFASSFDVQLEAFDYESKRMSVALRHDGEREVPRRLVPIVSAFEELCDLYPDIIGVSYGGGSTTMFRRFHERYLPRLLRSVRRWAIESGQDELEERVRTSAELVGKALAEMKW